MDIELWWCLNLLGLVYLWLFNNGLWNLLYRLLLWDHLALRLLNFLFLLLLWNNRLFLFHFLLFGLLNFFSFIHNRFNFLFLRLLKLFLYNLFLNWQFIDLIFYLLLDYILRLNLFFLDLVLLLFLFLLFWFWLFIHFRRFNLFRKILQSLSEIQRAWSLLPRLLATLVQ